MESQLLLSERISEGSVEVWLQVGLVPCPGFHLSRLLNNDCLNDLLSQFSVGETWAGHTLSLLKPGKDI